MSETESLRPSTLWMTRLYYFTWVGGVGLISPYLNLFLEHNHLSGVEIGLVTAIGAVVSILSAPLWTRQVEASHYPRRLLQGSILVTGALMLWFSQQTRFAWIGLITVLRALASAGISPLSDALAVRISRAARAGYGSVRVWGSLGWAVLVLASGWMVERWGLFAGFAGYAATCAVSVVILFGLQPQLFSPERRAHIAGGMRAAARSVLRDRPLVGLGLMYLFVVIGNAGVAQFEIIYMSQMGARASLIGVAGMAGSAVELAGMFLADRLIQRRGASNALMLAMLGNAILRLAVFAAPSPAAIVAARAVGGLSFSLFTVGIIRLIADRAPIGQTATVLALFTVTWVSLLNFGGSPLAGLLYDRLGAHWLYPISATGYLLALIALLLTRTAPAGEQPGFPARVSSS